MTRSARNRTLTSRPHLNRLNSYGGKPNRRAKALNSRSNCERVGAPALRDEGLQASSAGVARIARDDVGERIAIEKTPQGVVHEVPEAVVGKRRRVVEHGPGRTRHRDPQLSSAVAREEGLRTVNANSPWTAVSGHGDLELFLPAAGESPQGGRRRMAEDRLGAAGQHGGRGAVRRRGARVPDGVDPGVDAVETAGLQTIRNRIVVAAEIEQLLASHMAVLPGGECGNPTLKASVVGILLGIIPGDIPMEPSGALVRPQGNEKIQSLGVRQRLAAGRRGRVCP